MATRGWSSIPRNWLLFFAGELFTLSGHGVFLVADTETIVSRHGHIVELCSILAA